MNEIAITQEKNLPSTTAGFLMNPSVMQEFYRFAELMSASVVAVPTHFHGKPADCMAVVMQAARWGMDPFQVASKTHVVSGKLGYEAQLVNAVLQSSGAIRGRFHYEYDGDGQKLQCRVGAVPAGETEIVYGQWLCIADVKVQNSPLWKTNPKQQIGYLQVKNWGRQYAPGAILGVYTIDEIDTGPTVEKELNQAPAKKSLKSLQEAAPAAQQSAPAAVPEFEDAPADLSKAISLSFDCQTESDLGQWWQQNCQYAEGTEEHKTLSASYFERLNEIKQAGAM